MALSSYATMAFTHEGKPNNGAYISPCGVNVEVYKNWIYIYDEKAWQENGGFRKAMHYGNSRR